MGPGDTFDCVVIGAGPAGLTAASELTERGLSCVVLESDTQVGGISRTVVRSGWRFDLGGHRFFTKVPRVQEFWEAALPPEDFLRRPRLSRIYFDGKFYDYPLRASNALRNLGLLEATLCLGSYLAAKARPGQTPQSFEEWVAGRFGWRLYRTFFKTYTEKVWGVPATEITADWAAQRIRDLSLGKAIVSALKPRGRKTGGVTSLIEEFDYPRLGPGMLWEAVGARLTRAGVSIHFGARVSSISRIVQDGDPVLEVQCANGLAFRGRRVISSMPIGQLVRTLEPQAPSDVLEAAARLVHRDFLVVALVVPAHSAFPDNWIYIHSPNVKVGRIQNFGSWSPDMVQGGDTCLGLEYFVNEGDAIWEMDDDDVVGLAWAELQSLGLASQGPVPEGYVVRCPKAYPVYDSHYRSSLDCVRRFLEFSWQDVFPVGRNGMHRYNNQDHSMLTAMVTVDNITLGESEDVWLVNVDDEYHEEASSGEQAMGTGRSAPEVGRPV